VAEEVQGEFQRNGEDGYKDEEAGMVGDVILYGEGICSIAGTYEHGMRHIALNEKLVLSATLRRR
jgi:hypothetical protein